MRSRLLLIGLCVLWLAGSVHAQGGEPVAVTGTLRLFEPASDVLVRVVAGQPVTLTLSAPTIDPTLTVYDAVGQVLAFNDDHDSGFDLPSPRDAALVFTPSADAPVVVRVAGYNWAYAGDYTLTIIGATVLDQNPVSLVQEAEGRVVEGTLAAQEGRAPRLAYPFLARAGATVTLTLTSAAFDAMLDVFDEAGAAIAANDDHDATVFSLPARTDSALRFTAPADGLYVALVRSFEDKGQGRFTLTIDGAAFGRATVINSVEEGPRPGECDRVLGRVVAVSSTFGGDFAAGNLLDGDPATGWSSREGDAAPYLIFEVAGGAAATLDGVIFNGFSTSPGFENDSVRAFSVGVSTALVAPEAFTTVLEAEFPRANTLQEYPFAPVAARYVLLRLLSNYGGRYTQAAEFNACTTLSGRAVETLRGEPPYLINGQLRSRDSYIEYRLYALQNATLTVTLSSEAFDPVLEVYNSAGRLLADNDEHPPELPLPNLWDAGLQVTLPEEGELVVRARSFAGGGPFVLTIDGRRIQATPPPAPELPPCRDVSSQAAGGSIVNFSSEFGGRWQAAFLHDGSEETGWASAPGAVSARREFVILDLAGDVQPLARFRINPSATGGDGSAHNVSRFAVLVSETTQRPEAFREVFSTLLTERYRYTLSFELPPGVRARYVMLETRDTFGGRWHEVAEFTVCAAD